MAIVGSSLADGQLPNAKGTLYTVPTSKAAHAPHLILVNTDSSARTINLYVKRAGSSSRHVEQVDLSIAAGARHMVDFGAKGLTLSEDDEIEGDASAAAVVDYLICGGLEPA
jgi:hypothetical protein